MVHIAIKKMDMLSVIPEIEQVLNAPYPVSLRNLHGRLSRCSSDTVQIWTRLKPCQISPLLELLVSRSNTDDIATYCLIHLLGSIAVFDVIIRDQPCAFEAICAQQLPYLQATSTLNTPIGAITPQRGLNLLHMLPPGVSPPTSYYAMLEVVIASGENEPVGLWQERTYAFLADSTIETLSNISDASIETCVHRWATLMRSSNCVESLYAAYVASRLQRHAPNIATTDSSLGSCPSICPTLQAWIEKCSSIFRGGQVVETVKNTLARILKLACDERCRTLAHADDAIILAGNALNVALISYGPDWDKDTGPYTRKLAQKFHMMPVELQLASAHILALSDLRTWFPDVAQALQTLFHHVTSSPQLGSSSVDIVLRIIHRCIDSGLTLQARCAFDPFFRELVAFVIEQCRPQRPASPEKISSMYLAREIVGILHQADGSSAIQRLLPQAVTTTGLPDWWPLNMSTPGSPENCSGLQTCVHSDESLRQELCSNFSLLLLTSVASNDCQLPRNIVKVVKQRLSQSSICDAGTPCCYRPFVAKQQAIVTSTCNSVTSGNWREHLKESSISSARNVTHVMEETILAVTQDLQNRCDNVEIPLKEARTEVQQLLEHVQLLQIRLASCIAEKDSLQKTLRAEREERVQIAAAANNLQALNSTIQGKLVEAETRIEKVESELGTMRDHHRALLEDAQKNASAELEHVQNQHANKLTELEALLSSQAQATSALETETAWLKEQMEIAKNEMEAEHRQTMNQVRHRFEDEEAQLQEQIDSLRSDKLARDAQIEQLNDEIGSKDRTVSEMDRRCKDATDSIARLEAELRSERVKSDEAAQGLSAAKDMNVKLVAELSKRDTELEEQGKLLNELKQSASRWQQLCVSADKALTDARKREEGIKALLGGGTSNGSSSQAGLPGPRLTSAASAKASTLYTSTAAVVSRHPAGSLSEDDEEANYETKEIRQ